MVGRSTSDRCRGFVTNSACAWLYKAEIKTLYIDPGSPWQNGYIERFHSRFRDERLEREQLWTLTEARIVLEDWRREYNEARPHKSLGLETPKAYARAQQAGFSGLTTHLYWRDIYPTIWCQH
jgi:transposase InsO family protein